MPFAETPEEQAALNKTAALRSAASRKANRAFIGVMECEIAINDSKLSARELALVEAELRVHRADLAEAKADHAATGKEWRPRTQARILRERRQKLGDARQANNPRSAMDEREWLKNNARKDGRANNSLPASVMEKTKKKPTPAPTASDWDE